MEEDNNGIVKVKQNGVEYTVWTHANIVMRRVREELEKLYPGKIIMRELNDIDLSIPEENLPVEIQSTIVAKKNEGKSIRFSQWENVIRKQIDQDIIYGKCLFFFDSELLRAMKNASKGISINMDWFRKYMKEEKLIVFTVSYDGVVEPKEYKDFDFLADLSQTCIVAAETDNMILNKNKLKIFAYMVKGYGFTKEEIFKFENDYDIYRKTNKVDDAFKNEGMITFLIRQKNDRAKLYGYILDTIGNLPGVNQILNKDSQNLKEKYLRNIKIYAKILGIWDRDGNGQKCNTRFIDRFDICKYFPAYIRNKETWDRIKGRNLNNRQFNSVISGKNDVFNGLDHCFGLNENDEINNEGNDDNTDDNTTENSQIVYMNIENTRQSTIDGAWGS